MEIHMEVKESTIFFNYSVNNIWNLKKLILAIYMYEK